MSTSLKIAPPYSLVLICDPEEAEIPKSMEGGIIASTSSCIAVGCRAEIDGETEIVLGSVSEVDPDDEPIFQGHLKTPSYKIAVQTALDETILEMPVRDRQTAVRVWVNNRREPDKVIIGVG
jgi:hypothetical protein